MRKLDEWNDMRNDHTEQLLRLVALDQAGNDLMQHAIDLDMRDLPPQYQTAWDIAQTLYLAKDPFDLDSLRSARGIDLEVMRSNVLAAPRQASTPRAIIKLKRDIQDVGRRLRLHHAGLSTGDEALDPSIPIAETEQRHMTRLVDNAPSVVNARTFADAIREVLALGYEYHQNPKICRGWRTGFDAIDRMMNGLELGQYIILGGRPGMGKSAWAFQAAVGVAKAGGVVVLATLENSLVSVTSRMIAQEAGLSAYNFKLGLNDEEWDAFERAGERLAQMIGQRIVILDNSTMSIRDISIEVQKLQREMAVAAVIVDTLDKVADSRGDDRYAKVTNASLAFHDMVRALNVAGLAVKQLSRKNTERHDKRPNMADIRDSGAIEQDADKVLLIHRADYYLTADDDDEPNHIAEFILAKHRDGPTGLTHLYWEETWPGFRKATRDELLNGGISFTDAADASVEDEDPVLLI